MKPTRTFLRKAMAVFLAYSTAFGPGSIPAVYAASTDLSDVPLPALKRPLPNMIMSVDDSGSMNFEVSLNGNDGSVWYHTGDGRPFGRNTSDASVYTGTVSCTSTEGTSNCGTGPINFNSSGSGSSTWKKYVYLFPNGSGTGATNDRRALSDANNDHFAIPPTTQFAWMRSSAYNRQYYNPAITYAPWRPYNPPSGASCPPSPYSVATGSGSTYLCTPQPAISTQTRTHPIYPTSSPYLWNLEADVAKNRNNNYKFRMYAGMIIPNGADYRRCTGTGDGSGCNSWTTATENLCLVNNTVTSCVGMGMTSSNTVSLSSHDHAEVAIQYFPATYYVVDASMDPPDAYGVDGAKLRRVEVKSTNVIPGYAAGEFPRASSRQDCAGSVCTFAEERQNFANWFQFYRNRTLSLNAALGNALDSVTSLRGGYFLFNNSYGASYHTTGGSAVTMFDFDSVDTTKNDRRLLGHLFMINPDGGTPTRVALDRLGKQFTFTGSSAPVKAACQFNAGFIITDGFARRTSDPTWAGNYDGQTPGGTPTPTSNPTNYPYNTPYADPINTSITAPFKDNWSNTMADMAMYYYTRNLRPDLPAGQVPVNVNDITPDADRNPNIHMNLFGLVLGLPGRIFGNPAFPNENADPYTYAPNWNAINSTSIDADPSAIDELWHATINGRGKMLKADSPEEVRNGVLDIVNNIVARGGAAAAVSVSNANPVQGDNFSYSSSYNAGPWSGDLNAYPIDLNTGAVSLTPQWTPSPQKQLADRDWTTRTIATYDPINRVGIPLAWDSLTASQKTALQGLVVGPTSVTGQQVLDFLRGDRTNEGSLLRTRGPRKNFNVHPSGWPNGIIPDSISVLGDIVNAEPVVIGAPTMNYVDTGYTTFKTTNTSRQRVVYQPANDGMLHAFDASNGAELWAYVPSFGFLDRQGGRRGLRTLADKEFFVHQFFVDATPVSADIDTSIAGTPGTGTGAWQTILVGGLGKGGRGWYALDVTNPSAATDTAAAGKVLWEFPNSTTSAAVRAQIGYSYGRPIVVKTRAAGWVVLVASGYENGTETGGDGAGYLFVLNPTNGNVIAALRTIDAQDGASGGADRAANPRGLAYVSAYVENAEVDATVESVYGGDLYGNVWKFDLTGANVGDWNVKRLATLVDGSGNRQPVTSEPELGVVRGNRVVYVGTGRYFGRIDIPGEPGALSSATSTQSLYALKDDLSANPTITPLRSSLVQQVITKTGTTATLTNNPVDLNTTKGWYVDFPDTGERIITNPQLALGALVITTNVPNGSDPCIPGGSSWFYVFDYRTGSYIPGATYSGRSLGNALASRVVVVKLPNGRVQGLIRMTDASTRSEGFTPPGATLAGKRKSWRELFIQ